MTHWNLLSYVPTTSSNSNFLVSHMSVHEKKRSHETHGTKCYDNYLEIMESMNTIILWNNDTIRLVHFEFVLIRSNSNFDYMRKWKHMVSAGRLVVKEKASHNKLVCRWSGQYVMPIYFEHCEDKQRFHYMFRMWEHALHNFLTL